MGRGMGNGVWEDYGETSEVVERVGSNGMRRDG